MAASTRDLVGDGRDDQEASTGIVGSHAYSLLNAYELLYERGRYRVLKPYEKSPYQGWGFIFYKKIIFWFFIFMSYF